MTENANPISSPEPMEPEQTKKKFARFTSLGVGNQAGRWTIAHRRTDRADRSLQPIFQVGDHGLHHFIFALSPLQPDNQTLKNFLADCVCHCLPANGGGGGLVAHKCWQHHRYPGSESV